MDPNSSSSSNSTGAAPGATDSSWSAPMGGSASDGIPAVAAAAAAAADGSLFAQSPLPPSSSMMQQQPGYGYGYPQQQQQQQLPQPSVYGLASPQQYQQSPAYPATPPPPISNLNAGSITRFATPGVTPTAMTPQDLAAVAATVVTSPQQMSSYASRSTQAYGRQPSPQPQYQQFQQPQFQQQQQQPSPAVMPAAATSYAARSALAQQQQQPPPPQSFAARSAQAYATTPQQQQQQPAYSQQSGMLQQPSTSAAGAGGGGYAERAAQAYAQQQQQPSIMGGVGAASGAATGGYAARSAQAYNMSQQQYSTSMAATPVAPGVVNQHYAVAPAASPSLQPQQQQIVQPTAPPATGAAGGGGGYAARAAQAYATPQPQQQQQQQYQQQPQTMVGAGGAGVYNPSVVVPPPSVPGMIPQQQQQLAPPAQQQQQPGMMMVTAQEQANQQRMLTDATRKIQEHAYYMKQAMDQHNLPVVLDRASYMVGELGGPLHGQQASNVTTSTTGATSGGSGGMGLSNTGVSSKLTPKNYYELYMRALEDLPALEDYLLHLSQQQQSSTGGSNMMDNNNPLASQPQIHIVDTSQGTAALPTPTVTRTSFCMRELYDCVQYCPRVVSRLYLQISAGSALIRSGEAGSRWVLQDLICATRCEQNPIRGLFLRNYLLTALRDHLPDIPIPVETTTTSMTTTTTTQQQDSSKDGPDATSSSSLVDAGVAAEIHDSNNDNDNNSSSSDDMMAKGNVMDSVEFVMENFMEMNKLWVRIQHLPGEGRNKDVRKRRERERNDLRILVGTNLVRLSQLESVASKIYGESILPRILDHVVVVGDPLSQAYLMDCLVQVFPDEYHIETLPILLNVCPRLRDKVNIRTILQGLMDRLANYLAEEELLDESDTNQVKKELARDSFGMFEECVQKVYNARGPKLTSKEVIRLQTALLQFSLKVYPGNMQQVQSCMTACILALQQANASYTIESSYTTTSPMQTTTLDEASVTELEKLLSIPLESLALRVLEIEQYSRLITFLPFVNRRGVAVQMLQAVDQAGAPPSSVREIQQLFQIILPLIHDEQSIQHATSTTMPTSQHVTSLMAGLGINEMNQTMATIPTSIVTSFGNEELVTPALNKECALVSKLVHLLDNNDTDVVYEMLLVARNQICQGGRTRAQRTLGAVSFAALKLARRILAESIATEAAATTAVITPETSGVANGNTVEAVPSNQAAPKEEPTADSEEKQLSDEPAAADVAESTGDKDDGKAGEAIETPSAGEEAPADASAEEAPAEVTGNGTETPAAETEIATETPAADTEAPTETPPTETPDNTTQLTEPAKEPAPPKAVSARKVFVFLEETISALGKINPEAAVKLFLEAALTADSLAANDQQADFGPISYELLSQAFSFYEENNVDSNGQHRCVQSIIGTLMACRALSADDYATLITKTAQFSAKLVKKPSQCQMVALAAHLFYPVNQGETMKYSNAQRALECLQRALKLADACTTSNPDHVQLFVDLLEHYLFFFEKNNPLITHAYITGLVALIKQNFLNLPSSTAVREAQTHFQSILKEIRRKKSIEATAELFASVQVDNV